MHVLKTDFRKNWGLEKLGKNMMCVKNVFFFFNTDIFNIIFLPHDIKSVSISDKLFWNV